MPAISAFFRSLNAYTNHYNKHYSSGKTRRHIRPKWVIAEEKQAKALKKQKQDEFVKRMAEWKIIEQARNETQRFMTKHMHLSHTHTLFWKII
jgi:hypothetical protein